MDDLPEVFTRRRAACGDDADRREGGDVFVRADQEERLRLTRQLLRAHLDWNYVNDAAVAGALREAWHGEPCINGGRLGSYISAVGEMEAGEACWSPGEIALERGWAMMDAGERVRFDELEYPLTVHRGGVGDVALLTRGVSWTTDMEVASFYAHAWPGRGGFDEAGFVISMRIEEAQASALFLDRSESEILVPDGVSIGATFPLTRRDEAPAEMRVVVMDTGDNRGRILQAEPR